ncbi:MAG: long-chain fatty acid--CoA ligase [Gammaproteobacteria bacterium]|nr:MAG: long-chain fatty acid--CoA ligase [Gammaproteobacteria bacterium]
MKQATSKITPQEAPTISALFRERVRRTPDAVAYLQYDNGTKTWQETTWQGMAVEVGRWQAALQKEGLEAGDRVGVMLRNSREWVVFDQAAAGLGLITVPLYTDDRPDNVAWIAANSGMKLLVVDGRRQWRRLQHASDGLPTIQRIVSIGSIEPDDEPDDPRLESLADWLFGLSGELITREEGGDELATIVYTSGTTGRPKGVMLSHTNIIYNAWAASECAEVGAEDVFLSFLPLSHMLERTGGYMLPMLTGARVAFARSVAQLGEDLQTIRPTVLISVPRIYERVHGRIRDGLEKQPPIKQRLFELAVNVGWRRFEHEQGRAGWHPKLLLWPLLDRLVAGKIRARLGGRMRFAVCGGAPLTPEVARVFLGLGVNVLQGYGLTEASPVITVNRPDDNIPESIGLPLPGVEVRLGENDELLTRSPSVMLGYWENEEATREAIDEEGWLHSGDQARVDEGGHWYITGRIKEIIVLSNGEKVPPADMEMAIAMDPLFEQVMIIGEGRPFLSALVVLNAEQWAVLADELGVADDDPAVLDERGVEKALQARIAERIRDFPGYAQVRRVIATLDPWTIDDGLVTPTMKMKRARILERFADRIEALYREGRR